MMDRKLCKLNIHGGITYAGKILDREFKKRYWYFGFDTAHTFDLVPIMIELRKELSKFDDFTFVHEEKYRDINYVSNEVISLSEQLKMI